MDYSEVGDSCSKKSHSQKDEQKFCRKRTNEILKYLTSSQNFNTNLQILIIFEFIIDICEKNNWRGKSVTIYHLFHKIIAGVLLANLTLLNCFNVILNFLSKFGGSLSEFWTWESFIVRKMYCSWIKVCLIDSDRCCELQSESIILNHLTTFFLIIK